MNLMRLTQTQNPESAMLTVATIGPENSLAWQAARHYAPNGHIALYPHAAGLIDAFASGRTPLAVLPIYNTRQGENKAYFHLLDRLRSCYWIDNIVLPVNLSLAVFNSFENTQDLGLLIGYPEVFRQCEEYLGDTFPGIDTLGVHDIDRAVREIRKSGRTGCGIIDAEEVLRSHGLHLLERDVAPHNRTRYAVLGRELAVPTGYDATALITRPLDDRVGLLVDILSAFSRRGISILDMQSENDVKTQKLKIYLEIEGHTQDQAVAEAIRHVEREIIRIPGSLRLLGSFARVDMRTKHIRGFGFIGSGAMSQWFVERLENEGYRVLVTGRSSTLRPEEMIPQVDVVVVCVPISATAETVIRYAPLIGDGKALILLAGESETTVNIALQHTSPGVEVMLVHNLWGPQAATMKDKNAIVVRTPRSGMLCAEFEAFLYKHGADIFQDSPNRHDLLMGVGQKLPTAIAAALAMTLHEHGIGSDDIASHCTLTSLYPILAMARVHNQNPRTYAEILATAGDGRKIVHSFLANLHHIVSTADQGDIAALCKHLEENRSHFSEDFLKARMEQAKAVDEVLGRML